MAKKTAPPKKVAKKDLTKTSKAKSATKTVKTSKVTKSIKTSKASRPPKKEKKVALQAVDKPALMTKKSKKDDASEAVVVAEKKSKSVVSLVEADVQAPVSDSKVEKISKVKPVKVDRGNLADEKAKWAELFKKYGKEKAFNYKMTETYATLIPLQHKVLGWGFILTNENDRLEVLFENGIRMLISNYKPA